MWKLPLLLSLIPSFAGGNLYIASAPGQGTTITVTLRRTSEVPPTRA